MTELDPEMLPHTAWEPRDWVPRDPVEAKLIGEIYAGDMGAREVYADWLEERGEIAPAASVRNPGLGGPLNRAFWPWWRILHPALNPTTATAIRFHGRYEHTR